MFPPSHVVSCFFQKAIKEPRFMGQYVVLLLVSNICTLKNNIKTTNFPSLVLQFHQSVNTVHQPTMMFPNTSSSGSRPSPFSSSAKARLELWIYYCVCSIQRQLDKPQRLCYRLASVAAERCFRPILSTDTFVFSRPLAELCTDSQAGLFNFILYK